ncbi:hypothetical protein ABS238_02595 [Acinetobacter nosocomialis]
MRTKDFVQTIFLLCSIITIFIFGVIYYLMLNDNNSVGIIKESLTLTASFFGGIATLAAAYIATILFNDWRHQASFDLKKFHVNEISFLLALSYDDLHKMKEILINIKNTKEFKVLSEKYCSFKAKDLRDEFYSKQLNVKMLDRLNKTDNEIFKIYSIYQNHISYLLDHFNRIQGSYICYYNKLISEMGNAERKIMVETIDTYANSQEKNISEALQLQKDLSLKFGFKKENVSYVFNNIFEMIDQISIIYEQLETKVIDSIDLKTND